MATVNGTLQKDTVSGTLKGVFGSSGITDIQTALTLPISGAQGGTGVANTGKTITLGGNLITSGAFATTLTVTGATNITLPTTGTLAITASPTFTGTVTTAALNSSSFSATATNGIAASVTNNAAGFAPLTVTNNGAGNLQTWSNSGGTVATIGNSGALSLSAGVNATTGIFSVSTSGVTGSFANDDALNGYGLKIRSEGTAATRYALTLKNLAETSTYLHVATETGKVGNVGINTDAPTEKLHVVGNGLFTGTLNASNLSGTNTGDQTSVTGNAGTATALQTARNINGVSFNGTANITVTATPTAGTAVTSITGTADQVVASASTGAVTLSLPQSIAITSTPRFGGVGVGVTGTTIGLEVEKSVSGSYVGMLKNLNTTAGTSFGLFMNAGTNASDRALNINNAANSLGLFSVLGNGALEIGQTPATSAGTYDILTRNSAGIVEKISSSALPTLASGTYTPTGTTGTLVSAVTPVITHYSRVGNQVTVHGYATVTTTGAGTADFYLSLVIASNFTATTNLQGFGFFGSAKATATADITNDRVKIEFGSSVAATNQVDYTYQYTIL